LHFAGASSNVRVAAGLWGPAAFRFAERNSFTEKAAAMGDNIPMTRAGAEAIKRELKRLKSVERPKNVQDIATARDHGDLRENAEYHAAKEKQSHIEGRIQMLEDRLARAEIIDVKKLSGERVVFGATVKLEDSDSGQKAQYAIVGETEADLKKGRISITSPIARGLVGREVGDSVTIRTPGGEREYEILEVLFVEYAVEEESP
jgi:transcription elongation factor GreA